MATKRDLFQSYQFSIRRVVSGLVQRESDPAQSPLRRMGGAMFGSVMVAVLALAITGVVGAIKGGGNTSWQTAGQVIVEEETGATFVWLEDPRTGQFALHPTANLISGALLVGSPTPIFVSHASLAGAPRGVLLGIPGAPDTVPPLEDFDSGTWTICAEPAMSESGVESPSTALFVGGSLTSGQQIGQSSIVLRDVQTGGVYLVWNGHRFLLPDPDPARIALGLRDAPMVDVRTAMLTSFPEGDPIAPIAAANPGVASRVMPSRSEGQILVDNSTNQYYLVRRDELQNLSPVQALVTLAAPQTAEAYGGGTPAAITVESAAVTAVPTVELPAPQFTDPPRQVPTPAPISATTSTVCATYASGSTNITVQVDAQVEGEQQALLTEERTQNGAVLADRVHLTGGHAVLVRSMQSPTATEGPIYLVTDQGVRFAIPNADSRAALGLGDLTPVEMPASLVARIPEGPALDPVTARQPA